MPTKHKRKKRRSDKHKPRLTPTQREEALSLYSVTGNKAQVARSLDIHPSTVTRILKEAEQRQPGQVAERRLAASEEIAGRIHKTTVDVIESITPEDLESGIIKQYGDNGEVISARNYGPSLLQKTTSIGILTDKMTVLAGMRRQMLEGSATGDGMPLPSTIDGLKRAIGQRVKSMRIMDIQFDDHNPEMTSRVQDIAQEAGLREDAGMKIEADFEDGFDGP